MSEDEKVELCYFAVKNKNPRSVGWLPMVTSNGRELCSAWSGYGYAKDEAEKRALKRAREEAARYCGDWVISINEGESS